MSEAEEQMEVGGHSSDSSNSSDDEDQELIRKAEELETQISTNKYLYDPHVEIVEVYRKLGDLNSMRAAYQRFHECFPLTPKLWLDWIRDEIKIASTAEEKKHILTLFDKAVEDYLSVELWIEYAQYAIGVSDLQTTRSILERGLTAVGLHVSEGSLLWDTLRELEHAHVSLKEKGSEEWKTQVTKLADVFKRQLSVPLLGLESVHNEWQEWFNSLPEGIVDPKPVEWGYKNALKTLETYRPFEDRLLMAQGNEEVFDIYKEYIKAVKDPSMVLCLYERAATPLCLVPDLWLDYCLYAFHLGEAAFNVSCRALRNCPWSEELWIMKLRILENLKRDKKEVLACFEQATTMISPSPGLELWLTYLEYNHRNGMDVVKLDKLFSQAVQQLGIESDPLCKLSRWHARILASRGDMPAARKIWTTILHHTQNKGTASVWLEYANLERQFGDESHLRNLFQRALTASTDWPQYIAEEWLMFEREKGSLENVLKCVKKIKSVQIRLPLETTAPTATTETTQHGKKRRHEADVDRETSTKIKKIRSNRVEDKPEPFRNKHIEKDPKKTVFVSNLHPSVDEKKLEELFPNSTGIELVKDRKGKSRCYAFILFSKEEEAMTALARDRTPLDGRPVFISELKPDKTERKPEFKYATTPEANKLFVRGLPKTKTKEEVKELFDAYKPVDVRLVVQKNGQPKGLAYVEFENEEAAKKALQAMDKTEVDGQVIEVAVSAPPPKGSKSSLRASEPVRHARSRLQVPLVPRALQVKSVVGDSANGSGGKGEAPKSNEDFRRMLLKN